MTPAQRLGSRLRDARLAAGLTQRELSQRSGIRRQNLSRLEHGRSSTTHADHALPRLDTLVTLARALGVPVSSLVCVLDEVPHG